jgi:NACHT domain
MKITLVEGQMGAGKSKLLRQIVIYFTDKQVFGETKIIPIPTTFREIIDRYSGNIETLIDSEIDEKLRLEVQNENVTFLLVVDGIDEKKFTNEEQIENLRLLCAKIQDRENVRAVFASRPLEALEKSNQLDGLISSYELRTLSFSKTIEFIRKLCNKLDFKNRIVEDLRKSHLFSELPRSPISVILLANIINENPKDLPSSLTELYSKYVEWTLGRWDMKKGLQSQKEYNALEPILMNFAKFVMETDSSMIAIDEAKRMFDDYLDKRNFEFGTDELFSLLTDRTELVFVNPTNNTIGFRHRTFCEYFYAKAAIRDRDMLIDRRAFQNYWMNSFFFYIGLQKDLPDVIQELTKIVPDNPTEELLKIMNMPNFLMAAYTSPYEVITEGVQKVIIEAAELYQKITSGEMTVGLSRLPKMYLLWIFQALIREHFSYDFFITALEDAALSIADENIDNSTKMYALFFLNVAYLESGKGESFDFLLKDFAKTLPLDILLAYNHESKDIKQKSELMKRHDKRIKRLLGSSKQISREVQKLYENPIAELAKQAKKVNL